MTYNVTLIPGDGIGPEVTEQAVRVLEELDAGKISADDAMRLLRGEEN